jgi:hypothetical protein
MDVLVLVRIVLSLLIKPYIVFGWGKFEPFVKREVLPDLQMLMKDCQTLLAKLSKLSTGYSNDQWSCIIILTLI